MKVELYLKNINQEMIDAGRISPGEKQVGWTVSWPKECCILDFSLGDFEEIIQPAFRGYMLRKEKEGGMFWDPRSGAVYKVDEEAYHALLELDSGLSVREVARRMKMPVKEISSLVREVSRIASR